MSSSSERSGYRTVVRADAAAAAGVSLLAKPDLPSHASELDNNTLARTLVGEIADAARQQAHAQGYAVGWAQGRREARHAAAAAAAAFDAARDEAEARRQAEHEAAVAALAAAADQVRGLLSELMDGLEEQGTELAWAVTEQIMAREVAVATGADVVRRVLQALPSAPTATVRLHPQTLADDAVEELRSHGLHVVPDPTLGRADALVEADGSVTDLRIDTAMARVREVLS